MLATFCTSGHEQNALVHFASTSTWSLKLYGPHVGATLGLYVSLQGVVPPLLSDPNVPAVLKVPVQLLGRTVGQEPEPGKAKVPPTQS